MFLEISSKENSHYKELKKVTKEKSDYVIIEGKKLFLEAINSPLKIQKVYFDKKNQQYLSKFLSGKQNIEPIFINNALLSSIFTTDSKPDGEDLIIALAKKPLHRLQDLLETQKQLIFLERIQDPGNLGMIIRSAVAFNAGGIILSKGSVDPFNTKVIRASAGAVFNLPVISIDEIESFVPSLKSAKYKLVALLVKPSKASKNLSKIIFDLPCIFLFGNEGSGLSKEFLNMVDEIVTIPQSDKIESLNLGVAASLVLWELYKRKN
ncbi:MAG: RNA methyltransferase [Candidatus Melainabacteria bacterium]|nr:RNA methyltransferase [Candidatus Melainabacteria bacterium]